eukprot:gene45858-62106_t
MSPGGGLGGHSLVKDESVLKHKLPPGLVRRTIQFGRPYAGILAFFLFLVVLDAAAGVINPLIYRQLINHGILAGNEPLIIKLALLAALVSIVDSGLTIEAADFMAMAALHAARGVGGVADLRQQFAGRRHEAA